MQILKIKTNELRMIFQQIMYTKYFNTNTYKITPIP